MAKNLRQALSEYSSRGDADELIETLSAIAGRVRAPHGYSATDPALASTVWNLAQPDEDTKLDGTDADGDSGIRLLRQSYQSIGLGGRLGWQSGFELTGHVGRGGQGIVYLAECGGADGFASRHLALKVFSPHHYPNAETYETDMRRIAGVASIVATISQGNVLDVQRFEQCRGLRMMLLKYEEGYDLRKLMDPRMLRCVRDDNLAQWKDLRSVVASDEGRQTRFTPGAATAIVRSCLAALDRLHSRGVVHGDVKPSNLMLTLEGDTKLIDIGAAFEFEKSQQPYFCTPQYAAPEVLERGECTPKSDLASLGYVLIELLVGRPVFADARIGASTERSQPLEASTGIIPQFAPQLVKQKHNVPSQLEDLLRSYSPRLRDFCRRLIDPDPDRRFASARDADLAGYKYVQELELSNLAAHFPNYFRVWLDALRRQKAGSDVQPVSQGSPPNRI